MKRRTFGFNMAAVFEFMIAMLLETIGLVLLNKLSESFLQFFIKIVVMLVGSIYPITRLRLLNQEVLLVNY